MFAANTVRRSLLHRFYKQIPFVIHSGTEVQALFYRKNSTSNFTKMAASITGIPTATKSLNLLNREKSPYLLQHASNPINWNAWNSDAIAKSKIENKLIFLSIGYSTCHWCHVMERESFVCKETAKVLNEHYVPIKVDREERPDVDKIYMAYVQRTTGSGGWPLTLFLTPDLEPIFGGTYFPPEDDQGHVGLKSLLTLIAQQWKKEHKTLHADAKQAVDDLKKGVRRKFAYSVPIPGEESWQKCYKQILRHYDDECGGFSDAPKFPQPSMFNFLFHLYATNTMKPEGEHAVEMCLHTLRKMAYGGIHDHVNSGFARYSVDRKWHVPHFEKMLYDQAQLAVSYVDAFLVSKDKFYSDIVDDILTYVARDLSHPMGAFYGAEDADSLPKFTSTEKKEGAFCVWEYEEIKMLLTGQTPLATDFDIYTFHFKILPDGNVPHELDRHNELGGKNVLGCYESYEHTAENFDMSVDAVKHVLERCNKVLYQIRQNKPKPDVDTKILTGWNGLMLGAYAKAGFAMKKEVYTERAIKAATFIKKYLFGEKRLMRCVYGNGDGITQTAQPIAAFLDDYAYLIRGLIYLYEATLDTSWLEWAEELQDRQNEIFWDKENFGYFNCSADDTSIIVRDKEEQDGAEPCGNSVAIHNLIRLSVYLARPDMREFAKKTLAAYAHRLQEIPFALPEMTSALLLYHSEPTQIFLVGKPKDPSTQALLDVIRTRLLPGRIIGMSDGPEGQPSLFYTRNETFAKLKLVDNMSAAYVCRNFTCMLPVTSPQELAKSLDKQASSD